MKNEKELYELANKIAEYYLEYLDAMRKVFNTLADDELKQLVQHLDDSNKNTRGFRTTYTDDIVDEIEAELAFRHMDLKAKSPQAKWINGIYCPVCHDEECDCGEKHEQRAEKLYPQKSEEYYRINEMSRNQLIEELLKLKSVS